MTQLRFISKEHEEFFSSQIKKHQISLTDTERSSLIYTLGLNEITRKHIDEIYSNGEINPDCLHAGFQTSGTIAITELAFSLFNNFQERRPLLLDEGNMYLADMTDDFEYEYLDSPYPGILKGKAYIYEYAYPSLLKIFTYVDRELVPYMMQAILLRLNMIDL